MYPNKADLFLRMKSCLTWIAKPRNARGYRMPKGAVKFTLYFTNSIPNLGWIIVIHFPYRSNKLKAT